MKKIFSLAILLGLVATVADAAPSYIKRDGRGGYNVTYDYTDKAKSGYYIAGRVGVSAMSWKNKYDLGGFENETEKFSFKPVFDGSIAAGMHLDGFWRGEIEAGYMGEFSDKDETAEFRLSVPYLMVNGYYDFTNGLYAGAGVGLAFPIMKLDSSYFVSGDRMKTTISPMGGVMLGFAHKLDDNVILDLRYRLSGYRGVKHSRVLGGYVQDKEDNDVYVELPFETKVDFILDNTFSIGLRYEF